MKQQILVDHVSKSDILHDISFKISLNEKIAIVGPNGAGKSTLLKLIVGLSMPTKGRILTSCRQSMVFQNNLLDKKLSIAQNLRVRLNKEAVEHAESLLTQFGINDFLIKYEDLSGGQKRVVNLVRASVTHPEMLILDELSAGMDTQIRESVWRFLSELSSQRKMSIIYTTHILDELFYADKILFINKGRVGYFGDATDFRGKLPAYKLTVNNKDHLFESSEDAIEYIINQNMQKEQFEIRRVSYNDLFKYMENVFDDQIN